jgi:MoaA/NifB/PqqE/SkfB family radical SAM enzyme
MFGSVLPEDFSLHISCDGILSHDLQRGVSSLQNIMKTVKVLQTQFPRVGIVMKFTITPVNYREILPTYAFARASGIRFKVKLVERAVQYTNRVQRKQFIFSHKACRAIVRDLGQVYRMQKNTRLADAYFTAEVIHFLVRGKRVRACIVPWERVFIMPTADVFTCLYQKRVGNLRTDDLSAIWEGPVADRLRKKIAASGCRRCLAYHSV